MSKIITASFSVYPSSAEQAQALFDKGYKFSMMGCHNVFKSEEQGILEEIWLQKNNISFSVGYRQCTEIPKGASILDPEAAAAIVEILRGSCFRYSFNWQNNYISQYHFYELTQDRAHFSFMSKFIEAYQNLNWVDEVRMNH